MYNTMTQKELFFTLHIPEFALPDTPADENRQHAFDVLTALSYLFAVRNPLYIANPEFVRFDRSEHQPLINQFWDGQGGSYVARFLAAAQKRTHDAARNDYGYIRFPSNVGDPFQGSIRRVTQTVQANIEFSVRDGQRSVHDVLEAHMECNDQKVLTAASVVFRLEHQETSTDIRKISLLYVWDGVGTASQNFREHVAHIIRR